MGVLKGAPPSISFQVDKLSELLYMLLELFMFMLKTGMTIVPNRRSYRFL